RRTSARERNPNPKRGLAGGGRAQPKGSEYDGSRPRRFRDGALDHCEVSRFGRSAGRAGGRHKRYSEPSEFTQRPLSKSTSSALPATLRHSGSGHASNDAFCRPERHLGFGGDAAGDTNCNSPNYRPSPGASSNKGGRTRRFQNSWSDRNLRNPGFHEPGD